MVERETYPKDGADLFEQVLERNNLNKAFKQVKRNGGAPGVDRMTVDGLLSYLHEHKKSFLASLRNGTYRPQPVRRAEHPEDGWRIRYRDGRTIRRRRRTIPGRQRGRSLLFRLVEPYRNRQQYRSCPALR